MRFMDCCLGKYQTSLVFVVFAITFKANLLHINVDFVCCLYHIKKLARNTEQLAEFSILYHEENAAKQQMEKNNLELKEDLSLVINKVHTYFHILSSCLYKYN